MHYAHESSPYLDVHASPWDSHDRLMITCVTDHKKVNLRMPNYRIEGNFRGVKISRIEAIKNIAGEIFADCTNIINANSAHRVLSLLKLW